MPRRPQDPNHSCDINIPTTMPGTPITIDASENVRLKVLENRMVPKNTSHLDKPDEFDDFKENDYLYVSNDNGELRKFPIRSITAEKALDYTEAYGLVVEDASQSLIGKVIDQLEASKFNRLPIRNAETFHLYIYLTEEVNGNRTTTGAFVCTAETTDIDEPIEDPTAHITAVILSAISLGDDFESITINEHKAPIINGNIPISIRFNGTEFATTVLNNKLATELTATINGQEIPIDNQSIAKTVVRINGEDVPMDDTKPGVIDLDIDTRINNARQAEEDRATAAEDALANDLDEERRVRIENDDILQSNIDTEEARAKAAEVVLQNNIDIEETRAKAAELAINNTITAEIQRSIDKDTALDTKINTEISNARAAEAILQTSISIETDRAKAAEAAETNRATTVENVISQNLAQSVENLSKIDAALQVNIAKEQSRAEAAEKLEKDTRITEDERVLNTAKAYTDSEIDKLDVETVGGTGSYIKAIYESNGKIFPEAQAFATADSIRLAESNDNAPGVLAVKTYVAAQDKLITDRLDLDEVTLSNHNDRLSHFEAIVPNTAGKDNILADRDFVNSSIATSTAAFFGTYNTEIDLHINVDNYAAEPDETALQAKIEKRLSDAVALNWLHVEQPTVYPALKNASFSEDDNLIVSTEIRTAINKFKTERYTNLDYIFVAISESHAEPNNINHYERYKFVKSDVGLTGWYYEYCLNNSGFTSDQWKAINSGVTAEIRENTVNDHNLIHETHTDGAILTKDENGNTVWENLLTEIPCKDVSEASNTMAPTAKAVVEYVEQHFVDHLDSDIKATDGNYFNRIEITNGKLDNDKSTRKSFVDFIGEETKNSSIAPQTKAVKSYVDGLTKDVEPGQFIESIKVNDEGRIRTNTKALITDIAQIAEDTSKIAPTSGAVKTYVDGLAKDRIEGEYLSSIEVDTTSGKIATKSVAFDKDINSSSDNTTAPTSKAVKDYVDGLAIKVNNGEYIESIQINEDGKIHTTTEHLINDIASLEELNKDRAPTADAVKTYVDNTIDSLDSDVSITDGYYFKKITIKNGILQPVGNDGSNSQIKIFDDRAKLEEGVATADNIPSTLAVLEKFNSNGFIVCSSADNMAIYQAKKYNNCYIKYTGPSTADYTYGDIYLVVAPNDGNKGWDTLNTEFNRTEDQKDGITTIKEATLGEGYIVLESESSATSFITGDQKQSYTYTTSSNINDSHVDAALAAKWNSGTTKTAKIPTDITFSELGKVYGISVNAGDEKAPFVQTTHTVNIGTDSTNTSVEYDENISFDNIRNMHYGKHTIKYHASCAKAYIKGNVQLLLQSCIDSNNNIFSEGNNKGIASLWISYINRQGVLTYKRLKTLIHGFTGSEKGNSNWYYYNSDVEPLSDAENGYEIDLTDIQTVNDYKSISIICSTEAYKVTGSDVCYYYVWGAFTGIKTLALMKTGEVAQVTMNPAEVAEAISTHNTTAGREGKVIHADIWTAIESSEDNITNHNTRLTSLEASVNGTEDNDGILEMIPTAASSTNKLADKTFVNSSIATATANFLGTYIGAPASYGGANNLEILGVIGETVIIGNEETLITDDIYFELVATALNSKVQASTITNNDYVFVAMPETSAAGAEIVRYDRFKFVQIIDPQTGKTKEGTTPTWEHEYKLNNSGFTAEQWSAINSGITEDLRKKIHDIPENFLVSAKVEDDKLTITTNKDSTVEFEGGKIKSITVNNGDALKIDEKKNVNITIPAVPVQSVAVKDINTTVLTPDSGQVTVDISEKANKADTLAGYGITDAMTTTQTLAKVGTEIGNVITKNDYIEETTYEEFEG